MSLECKQLENVLLLIKISFVNTFICLVNISMKALFKVLKQNLSQTCVLESGALGKLTLCMTSI